MELRHLRYFVVAAEECHFTRAAKRLGIAQPPLSQQIQQLENELGFLLFHRLPRGVALTGAGQRFLIGASSVLDRLDDVIKEAREIAHGTSGTIHIGFTSSAAFNGCISNLIGKYRQLYPNVVTNLHEGTSMALSQLLRSGDLDAAFIRLGPDDGRDLPYAPVIDEEMKLAVPSWHRLAAAQSVEMVELAHEQFVMFPRANGQSLFEAIISSCLNAGFSPNVVQEAPQMASSISLVAAGVGLAFVPLSMCNLHTSQISYLTIRKGGPRAVLHLATRGLPQSPSAAKFANLVKQEMTRPEAAVPTLV
jgi:DNA-binding transcriptional LysR family regulator